VRSARRFYRLAVTLGAAGTLAVVLAVAVALRALDLGLPSPQALREACGQVLPSALSAGSLLVLGLAALSITVLGRGTRSLLRQLQGRRRTLAAITVPEARDVGGERVLLIDDPRPLAFCAGYLRPRVYLSTGAMQQLGVDELTAVLAHEAHHARRRDPLRLLIAAVLGDALFFLPALRRLHARYATLAELAADEAAVRRARDPAPLASALLAFGETPQAGVVGIAPERVDHLLGERTRWELPTSLLVAALVTIAGLLAVTLLAARTMAPGGLDLAMLSAESCMIAMTVGPIALAAGLLVLTRQRIAQARR